MSTAELILVPVHVVARRANERVASREATRRHFETLLAEMAELIEKG